MNWESAIFPHRTKALKKKLPALVLHTDDSPSDWDVRRGEQDIKEKK